MDDGEEASAEFLVLTKEPEPIRLDQFLIECDPPFRVEPILAKSGVATFRVFAKLLADAAESVGRVTIRTVSIADEFAVLSVAARRTKR